MYGNKIELINAAERVNVGGLASHGRPDPRRLIL